MSRTGATPPCHPSRARCFMAAAWALAVLDALVVGALYFALRPDGDDPSSDTTPSSAFALSRSTADLAILAGVRCFANLACAAAARRARRWWFSRRTLRRRLLAPRVVAHLLNLSCASYALIKGLSRVVEQEGGPSWPYFLAMTLASILLPLAVLYALRAMFASAYTECQAARLVLRKDARDAASNQAPLLAQDQEASISSTRASKSVMPVDQYSPSRYVATKAPPQVSDHDSDDDSSSGDDELQANSVSERLRIAERGRRLRERRRKVKEDKDQKLSTGASVYELLRFAAPDWPYLVLAFVCLVTAAISGAMIPKFTGEVINHVSGAQPDRAAFKVAVVKLTLAAVFTGVFSGLRGALFTVAGSKMNVRLRTALYESLLRQEQAFFDSTKVGDLSSRLNSSTTTVSDQIALNVNVFLRSIVEGSIVLVLMFGLSWRLSLLSLAAIPIMTWISSVYGAYYRRLENMTADALADTSGMAEEALGAIGTVRDFGARPAEVKIFRDELNWFFSLNVTEAIAYTGYNLTWTAFPALITALTLYEGGKMVLNRDPEESCGNGHALCSGDLVTFMLLAQSLSNSVDTIGYIFNGLAQALGAADKIFDLMKRKPAVALKNEDDDSVGANFVGTIELRDVSFKYPNRPTVPVLDHFSLSVSKGEVVALVGESGGGKSSVIKLVLRHYEPDSGEVLVSGVPVASLSPHVLRTNLSVVQQEPTLFGRSVFRNIVYGLEGTPQEPTMEQVIAAAKLALAHDFIVKLPKGYQTLLGERGSTLSGGQRQRLCIARAIVRKPKILLLDEATSALDAESEAKVLVALDNIIRKESLSVLVVAHRLSSIRQAHKIVVVDKGKVAEVGTHDELLAKGAGGKYSELIQRQIEMAGVPALVPIPTGSSSE